MMKPKKTKVVADHGEPSNVQSEDDQPMRSLLTSLDKVQLVEILSTLGMKIPQAAEGIRATARPTALHRKLIVNHLSEKTTSESLSVAFSLYGEVEHANVAFDETTEKSRCIGFITFKSLESVTKALEKQKTWVDGHLAFQRPPNELEDPKFDINSRKLFVSPISSDVTREMLIGFFKKYGEVEKCGVIYDKIKRMSKGFGFVTFETVEDAKAAISDKDAKFLGRSRVPMKVKWYDEEKKKVQESATDAPHGFQSEDPHPHFSGHEPDEIPLAYQDPTETYQPQFVGYEPYQIPVPVQPPTVAYEPYFGGYAHYGIPPTYQPLTIAYQPPTIAYQPQTVAYHSHFSGQGYAPYGIPPTYQPQASAYQPPTGAYQPQVGAYQPRVGAYQPQVGAYQPPTGAYQPRVGAYQPPTGYMAYPYYFAYQ